MSDVANKKPWLSKTLWVNVVVAVAALAWPPAAEYIQQNPEIVMAAFAGLNVILRLVTKEKISLQD